MILPVAPPRPPIVAAPIRNRAAYTAEGDNANGIQAHSYQTIRQMWNQVGGYFGPKGRLPAINLDQPVPKDIYATTTRDDYPQGEVNVGRGMQQALSDQQHGLRDYALGAVIHELAHAFQKASVLDNADSTIREGGADAFERAVAPTAIANALLGNPDSTPPATGAYDGYVAKALAKPGGKAWIMRGQFR